jgi:hypothetical protein
MKSYWLFYGFRVILFLSLITLLILFVADKFSSWEGFWYVEIAVIMVACLPIISLYKKDDRKGWCLYPKSVFWSVFVLVGYFFLIFFSAMRISYIIVSLFLK